MLPSHRLLRPVSPLRWFPGWQLLARLAQLLGRELALSVCGYGLCAATARPSGLTARLTKEIDIFVAHWRRRPDSLTATLKNLVEAVSQHTGGGPLGTTLRAGLLAALNDADSTVRWIAAEPLGSAVGGDRTVVAALLAALKAMAPLCDGLRPRC
jgi:hypothetical protein